MNKRASEVANGRHVAVVGAGLVGAGWAIVFARAGLEVRIFDSNEKIAAGVMSFIQMQLVEMEQYDLCLLYTSRCV